MELSNNKVFSKVFMWLAIGLFITFGVGYGVSVNDYLLNNVMSSNSYLILCIATIAIAVFLSVRIHKMSGMVATILYLLYTALTGLTFGILFATYRIDSIIFVFGITAVILLIFGLIGYFTKIDLTKLGVFLFAGIIAIIIAYVLSLFIHSATFNLAIVILSIVIFLGYIAYDIQMIKRNLYVANDNQSLAIFGAFQLYLDFINVFIDLLRLIGREK